MLDNYRRAWHADLVATVDKRFRIKALLFIGSLYSSVPL